MIHFPVILPGSDAQANGQVYISFSIWFSAN